VIHGAAEPMSKCMSMAIAIACLSGCMTEAQHTHLVTLPSGQPGYMVTCNSNSYDRCLNRAARACRGAYTIVPEVRSTTVRVQDPVAGIGNSESITVACSS
jgi:hypothetical protein